MLATATIIAIAVPVLLCFALARFAEFTVKQSAFSVFLLVSFLAFALSVEYLKCYFAGNAFSVGMSHNLHIRK